MWQVKQIWQSTNKPKLFKIDLGCKTDLTAYKQNQLFKTDLRSKTDFTAYK